MLSGRRERKSEDKPFKQSLENLRTSCVISDEVPRTFYACWLNLENNHCFGSQDTWWHDYSQTMTRWTKRVVGAGGRMVKGGVVQDSSVLCGCRSVPGHKYYKSQVEKVAISQKERRNPKKAIPPTPWGRHRQQRLILAKKIVSSSVKLMSLFNFLWQCCLFDIMNSLGRMHPPIRHIQFILWLVSKIKRS